MKTGVPQPWTLPGKAGFGELDIAAGRNAELRRLMSFVLSPSTQRAVVLREPLCGW